MHAGTKTAFEIVADSNRSKNPAMTDLLRRIVKTVFQRQQVEVVGTLFSELCSIMRDDDVNARQLLTFVSIVFWVSHASSSEFSYFGVRSWHVTKRE